MLQVLVQIFTLGAVFAAASVPSDAYVPPIDGKYQASSKYNHGLSMSRTDVVASATSIPTDGFLADSRYSTSSQEHEDKMNVLVSQCRFPKALWGPGRRR